MREKKFLTSRKQMSCVKSSLPTDISNTTRSGENPILELLTGLNIVAVPNGLTYVKTISIYVQPQTAPPFEVFTDTVTNKCPSTFSVNTSLVTQEYPTMYTQVSPITLYYTLSKNKTNVFSALFTQVEVSFQFKKGTTNATSATGDWSFFVQLLDPFTCTSSAIAPVPNVLYTSASLTTRYQSSRVIDTTTNQEITSTMSAWSGVSPLSVFPTTPEDWVTSTQLYDATRPWIPLRDTQWNIFTISDPTFVATNLDNVQVTLRGLIMTG